MKHLSLFLPVLLLAPLATSFTEPKVQPTVAASAAESFSVDAAHSSLTFRTKHLEVAMFHGRFNELSGELTLDQSQAGASKASIVVQAASIDTNSAGRDKHLRSNDFFSVKEFPEIRFDSTKIKIDGKRVHVTGDLQLHGIKRSVEATGEIIGKRDLPNGGHKLGVEVNFEINMADYDIAMVEKAPGAVGPEVYLTLSLECDRK